MTDSNHTCAEVYTCSRLPMSYIVKIKLSPNDEGLFRLYSEEDGKTSHSLVTLYSLLRQKDCECRHFLSDALISYW